MISTILVPLAVGIVLGGGGAAAGIYFGVIPFIKYLISLKKPTTPTK